MRSTDSGRTWERVGHDVIDPEEDPTVAERRGVEDGISVMSISIDPSNPDHLWVGTEPSALFQSTDGGESWSQITGIHSLESNEAWSFPPRPYTHHVRCVQIDPHDSDRVYVGIEAGALLVTPDGGETWIDRPDGSRRDNHALATHQSADGRVYSAAGDGYAESIDNGMTWEVKQDGLEHTYVWGLAVDPADPTNILISSASGARYAHGHGGTKTAESYVYRYNDNHWEQVTSLPVGEGTLRAVLSAYDHDSFFATNNQGVFYSSDYGDSWDSVPIELPTTIEHNGARDMIIIQE